MVFARYFTLIVVSTLFLFTDMANAVFSITVQPSASYIKETSAKISWSLSEKGTGQVRYGLTTAYGMVSILESSFDYSSHGQYLTNLTPGTVYHYQVVSKNAAGVQVVSADNYFKTLGTAPVTSVPVFNVRDYGATPNDSTDDTAEIQQAINAATSGSIVFVPAGKYRVNGVATTSTSGYFLKLKSNIHFKMDPSAILQIIPNSAIRYYGLSTNGADNVEISGGTIIGDRYQHTYTAGSTHEWGMCIGVKEGSTNVNIHDITVKDCTGDGIVTGGQSHDILIERVLSTNNRRQGLSLTNSYDVVVRDSEFSYTNGTAPEAGIDIEPDLPREARNITIENNKIHHNAKVGVLPYIQSYGLRIANNEISYNNHGIYVRGSQGAEIVGNVIKHNRNHGLKFENQLSGEIATSNYVISNNKFINNSTNAVGLNSGTGTLTSITGIGSGTIFTYQVQILSNCCEVRPKFYTNQFAK